MSQHRKCVNRYLQKVLTSLSNRKHITISFTRILHPIIMQDERAVVDMTKRTLHLLTGSKYFSKLDLNAGYWQVELDEEDKEKTEFQVGGLGFYECNRMPFGLSNAPATYECNRMPFGLSNAPATYECNRMPFGLSYAPATYECNRMTFGLSNAPATYECNRLPFGLSNAPATFQK